MRLLVCSVPLHFVPLGVVRCSHQLKHSASRKGAGDMQPELAMACSTDSQRLVAKEERVTAMGAASQSDMG